MIVLGGSGARVLYGSKPVWAYGRNNCASIPLKCSEGQGDRAHGLATIGRGYSAARSGKGDGEGSRKSQGEIGLKLMCFVQSLRKIIFQPKQDPHLGAVQDAIFFLKMDVDRLNRKVETHERTK